ncbi:MAG: hypothetical protein ACI89J_000749 [Hyphomicrobiaceae bacterium]|jgi:hypothetical protein
MVGRAQFADRAKIVDATQDAMLSKPCRKGDGCLHQWTLTSRLGHILETYEQLLGPRNRTYRVLGVEFTTSERPRVWYPDFGSGLQSVIVQLTQSARHNRKLALFQLGHEAFHLVEPIDPGTKGSFFEEGLASYFAVAYLDQIGIRDGAGFIAEKTYRLAYDLVARLAKQHSDFNPRLKRFRERHRSFSQISADDIRAAFPEAPAAAANQLARPFPSAAVDR